MALTDDLAAEQNAIWSTFDGLRANVTQASNDVMVAKRDGGDVEAAEASLKEAQDELAAKEARYRDLIMLSMTLAQFPSMESAVAAEFAKIMAE